MSTQKNKRVAKIESTNKKTVEYNKKVVVEKNKGGRPSKRLKYVEERKDVLNKLYYKQGDPTHIFYLPFNLRSVYSNFQPPFLNFMF